MLLSRSTGSGSELLIPRYMAQIHKEWCIFLCVIVGLWYFLGTSHTKREVQQPKTCLQWNESVELSNRCIRSLAQTLPIDDLERAISFLTPKEMIHLHDVGTSDWYSLVLFPSIEYEVVRRCVLEGKEYSYCDSAQREEYHRLVDKKLVFMMTSKNEEVQHRGMILACERSKKGRILDIPENMSLKVRNMISYTQMCTESKEKRQERIQSALKEDSLRSMALLAMILNQDLEIPVAVAQTWTPLERSLLQGVQE